MCVCRAELSYASIDIDVFVCRAELSRASTDVVITAGSHMISVYECFAFSDNLC